MCAVLFAISVVDAENSAGKGEHLAASHKHRGVDFAGGVYAEPGHEQCGSGEYHRHCTHQLGFLVFHELISFF